MDSQGLNHWHTVSWDPGVADSRVLSVCYDCICLMALFRVVDRLGGYLTEIKVPGLGLVLSEDKNNSARRCACMHRTLLGVFSVGRISLTLIGCRACVGGSVNCSDCAWTARLTSHPGESGSTI